MFKSSFTEQELDELVEATAPRRGWDFSRMHTIRQPVPWNYPDVVAAYLRPADRVLDLGTGGGERFMELSKHFNFGIGVDIDPEMVAVARENARGVTNVDFRQDDHYLNDVQETFDVVLCRHAPYDMDAVSSHLNSKGYFVHQDVGEKNMQNVKRVIGQDTELPTFSPSEFKRAGFHPLAVMEYDVEYVVQDVESLVFWLQALDQFHADLPGGILLGDVETFNQMLDGNLDERGFVTNEHRYMIVAQR